jgi:hypothetical protein
VVLVGLNLVEVATLANLEAHQSEKLKGC